MLIQELNTQQELVQDLGRTWKVEASRYSR